MRVRPAWPSGGGSSRALAAPAELRMPLSQLERERQFGLQPVVEHSGGDGPSSSRRSADAGDGGEGGSAAAASSELYSYNSSAITPLVPLWLSWMTDPAGVQNRSRGLDFGVAKRLSAYTAIAYCNASNIGVLRVWSCRLAGFVRQRWDQRATGSTIAAAGEHDACRLQPFLPCCSHRWRRPLELLALRRRCGGL